MKSFKICNKLGSGSFGDVYKIKKNKSYYALKVEKKNNKKRSMLEKEFKIYEILKDIKGIPRVYYFYEINTYKLMIMDYLGKNLEEMFNDNNKKLDISIVLKLGINILNIISSVHKLNIIHRDIKPSNFLLGRDKINLYLSDFGMSEIIDINDKNTKSKSLIGTLRYISINVHNGFKHSKRDDLESIGYMLIYFLKGKLPWQSIKKNNKTSLSISIKNKKIKTSLKELCSEHDFFYEYMKYCRELDFFETPNYEYLKYIFIKESLKNDISLSKIKY